MRRMARRRAEREGQVPHTLHEIDVLLLVADESRQGALRVSGHANAAHGTPLRISSSSTP